MPDSSELQQGFRYLPDVVSAAEERLLLDAVAAIDLADVRMRGMIARRRTAHFGWIYGYQSRRIEPGPPLPEFLLPLRERAARLGGVRDDELAEGLVTEYPAGAGIGWHRDAPVFGVVIGVSLLGDCRLRLRRDEGRVRQERAVALAARSAYVLDGATRWAWEHSIPTTRTRRYSITFRTLRRT